eukprot:TRINITY_DN16932_c0_g1_i1.p1 TRINITY_DN16932_c0_g1~~TRINITY_DN16932_c0_g1_i1.p1  ORF type:complete len:444 (-),score=75.77 TRINITY_DN16932_c0_g1_i1:38-1369(-)
MQGVHGVVRTPRPGMPTMAKAATPQPSPAMSTPRGILLHGPAAVAASIAAASPELGTRGPITTSIASPQLGPFYIRSPLEVSRDLLSQVKRPIAEHDGNAVDKAGDEEKASQASKGSKTSSSGPPAGAGTNLLPVGAPVEAVEKIKWRRDGTQMPASKTGSWFKVEAGAKGVVESRTPLQVRWENGQVGVVGYSQVSRDPTPALLGRNLARDPSAGKKNVVFEVNISTPSGLTHCSDTTPDADDNIHSGDSLNQALPLANVEDTPLKQGGGGGGMMTTTSAMTTTTAGLAKTPSMSSVQDMPLVRAATSLGFGMSKAFSTHSMDTAVSSGSACVRRQIWPGTGNNTPAAAAAVSASNAAAAAAAHQRRQRSMERRQRIMDRQRDAVKLALKPRLIEQHFWTREPQRPMWSGPRVFFTDEVLRLAVDLCRRICRVPVLAAAPAA